MDTSVTLYKNNAATAMTVTIPAGSASGTQELDAAHPTLFVDGDVYDIVAASAIDATSAVVGIAIGLEWAV